MKYTSSILRRGAAPFLCSTLILAFSAFQAVANPFNNGTSTNITSDIAYGETLYIGIQNPDNHVTVSSNATVSATRVIVGDIESSTNNSLSVIGDALLIVGNADTNGLSTGGIVIGDTNSSPSMSVDNASIVNSDYLYIGFGTNDSGSMQLAGEDTAVNIANDVYVGYAGSTNSIDIADGAALNVSGMLNVGSAGGSNNTVNVSGGSLFVTTTNSINVINADADNGITIGGNGTLKIGGDVDTATLDDLGVDLNLKASLEVGGSLVVEGNAIEDSLNIILNNDLSAGTSHWQISSVASIGDTTSNNSLTLTNGGTATAEQILRLGNGTISSGNSLFVGGTNSLLTAQQDVFVGAKGKNNDLIILDGGAASIAGNLYLGNNSGATGNEVTVGSNGVLHVGNDVIVGDNGSANTFTITTGQVTVANDFILGSGSIGNRYSQTGGTNTVAGEFIIGRTEDATGVTTIGQTDTSGNLGSVGTNATLHIQQNLTIGQEGGGSILLIHDGGTVNVDADAIIGEASDDNYIFLQPDDPDTRFHVAGDLVVGKEGGNNRFAVYGGTANIDGNLYLGSSTNQHVKKNYIHMETTNAVLNVANAIYIGASNSINTLDLVAGAKVSAQDLFVGTYDGVSNNVVTVTGNDSLLSISNTLAIGSNSGSNNAVNIDNGGILFVLNPTNIVIGATATNDLNNRLNVNSGGTLHTIDWDYATVSTNIVLNSGSTLELDGVFSGTNQLDGGIELALNGTPATTNWNTGTNILSVGSKTGGNTLTIKEGGLATTSTNLIVGNSSKSIGNALSVTGLTSQVTVGNDFIVGNKGSSGNALNILGGGTVNVTNNFILGSSSRSNTGLLEGFVGTNSTLNVMGNLTVGSKGGFNTLQVSSNAIVNVDGTATIGSGSGSANNTFKLTGSNAVLNVANNLVVGAQEATGNALDILGGGTVHVTNDFILGSTSDNNRSLFEGLEGENSTLHVMGDLTVGLKGDSNTLEISSNAVVNIDGLATIGSGADSANNIFKLTGSNAVLNVTSNLVVGAKAATGNGLIIDGGTATLDYDLIIGSLTNSDNNAVAVLGSNSTLNVGNNLIVGDIGSGNTLTITNGAVVNISGNAWIGLVSANNLIEVRGTNSSLMVGNDLFMGSTNGTSTGNQLGVFDMANIFVGGNLVIENSRLFIDYGSQVEVNGNYEQDGDSSLSVWISTNSATTNLVVAGTANFGKDTIIAVNGDGTIPKLVEEGVTNKIERTIVAAGTLRIAEQDATTALLHSSINFQTNALVGFNYTVTNNTIFLDNFIKRSWADAAGLEGMLAKVADEIENMVAVSNEFALAMDATFQNGMTDQEIGKAMNDYYGEKASSAPMHNVINQGIGSIAAELTVRGDNTRERTVAEPAGAAGPHSQDQELQGWIAGYGTWGDKSAADGFDAYDANLNGFIIGADLAVSKGILVGLSGGSNSGSVDKDNGASGDTKTTYGAVYASAGTKDWFMDGSVIYGTSTIDNRLGDVFDTAASYDAMNLAFYLGGGKEIVGQYLIITPQASLLANYYEQDAYDEKSTDAVARSVDSFDALYVQSSLGCNLGVYMAMGETTLKPELRAHWLHEFNAKEEDLAYTLIEGNGTPYNMLLQAPEEDILKLGAGVAAKMSEYLELRADLDTRWGSAYSDYTVSGSIRYQF